MAYFTCCYEKCRAKIDIGTDVVRSGDKFHCSECGAKHVIGNWSEALDDWEVSFEFPDYLPDEMLERIARDRQPAAMDIEHPEALPNYWDRKPLGIQDDNLDQHGAKGMLGHSGPLDVPGTSLAEDMKEQTKLYEEEKISEPNDDSPSFPRNQCPECHHEFGVNCHAAFGDRLLYDKKAFKCPECDEIFTGYVPRISPKGQLVWDDARPDNISNELIRHRNEPGLDNVLGMLDDAREFLTECNAERAVIIYQHPTENDDFHIGYVNAGYRYLEMVGLLEIAKYDQMRKLGLTTRDYDDWDGE